MARMYFIALVASKEINEKILKYKQFMKERFSCAVALRSPAHITLVPPFWMDETLENKLQNAISSFSARQNLFEVMLKNFAVFKPRVIYVDVLVDHSLQDLHFQLQKFLMAANVFPIKPEDRPFHPHITIATRDLHKKDFYDAWEVFKDKKYEASWVTGGISLLKHNQKNWDVIFTSQFLMPDASSA